MIRDVYVKAKYTAIKGAINKVENFGGDREIAAYLDAFLVVMISGVYEDCIEHILNNRAASTGDKEVATFVADAIDWTFRNPTYENLTRLVGRFSKRWVRNLNQKIRNEAKASLTSIVNNKNAVAHGNVSNLTIGEIKDFHKNCKSIFEKLEKLK